MRKTEAVNSLIIRKPQPKPERDPKHKRISICIGGVESNLYNKFVCLEQKHSIPNLNNKVAWTCIQSCPFTYTSYVLDSLKVSTEQAHLIEQETWDQSILARTKEAMTHYLKI